LLGFWLESMCLPDGILASPKCLGEIGVSIRD
jgi:hypothetical protein